MTGRRHFAFVFAILWAVLLIQPSDAAAQKNTQSSGTKVAAKKGLQKQPGGKKNASASGNLKHYTSSIVQKNLFRPLGWGDEEKKPTYALSAVVSDASDGDESRAIIEEVGGESYYVSEGDTFAGGVEVLNVDEQMVTLDRSGEEMKLRLGEGTSGNRKDGQRGGNPGRKGGRQPGRGAKQKGSHSKGGFMTPESIQKMQDGRITIKGAPDSLESINPKEVQFESYPMDGDETGQIRIIQKLSPEGEDDVIYITK